MPIHPAVLEVYNMKSHGCDAGSLSLTEYRDLILKLTESNPMTTIIIDALDECDPATRYDLLDALKYIQDESTKLVKLFMSSRDEPDLDFRLKDFPNIDTEAEENVESVKDFILWRIEEYVSTGRLLRGFSEQAELRTLIVEKTVERAGCM